MTEREILLKKISTYQFSILDLQIFLDTHPYDQQVLSQIKECKEKLLPLIEEYEEKYYSAYRRRCGADRRSIRTEHPIC